jgi:hypothetical protein
MDCYSQGRACILPNPTHNESMFYEDEEPREDHKEEATALAIIPPLAWDRHGKRFQVPQEAHGWRVQEKPKKQGGHPAPVFTRSGPLHIELDASFETLADTVKNKPGWYVLSLVDKTCRLIPNTPSAYVQVVPPEQAPPKQQDETATTVDRLCMTLQQLALYSFKRDEVICNALAQCSSALSEIQRSTAEILRAATSSLDIAAGAALPKLPPPPPAPQLPPPPPQKSVIDFLSSPAGNTTVAALANVVTSITGNKNS